MSKEEIEKIVTEAVADELGVDTSELSADTNLQKDMGADSLDAIEIVVALEHDLNVKFPDYDIFNTDLETISDITNFVEKHLNS